MNADRKDVSALEEELAKVRRMPAQLGITFTRNTVQTIVFRAVGQSARKFYRNTDEGIKLLIDRLIATGFCRIDQAGPFEQFVLDPDTIWYFYYDDLQPRIERWYSSAPTAEQVSYGLERRLRAVEASFRKSRFALATISSPEMLLLVLIGFIVAASGFFGILRQYPDVARTILGVEYGNSTQAVSPLTKGSPSATPALPTPVLVPPTILPLPPAATPVRPTRLPFPGPDTPPVF